MHTGLLNFWIFLLTVRGIQIGYLTTGVVIYLYSQIYKKKTKKKQFSQSCLLLCSELPHDPGRLVPSCPSVNCSHLLRYTLRCIGTFQINSIAIYLQIIQTDDQVGYQSLCVHLIQKKNISNP